MPIGELISLIRQGSISGSKSTAITPLTWTIGILTTGVLTSGRAGLPGWAVAILLASLIIVVLGFLAAYAYFAIKNPDALRTERYTLTKLAIEQYMSGDDEVGLTKVDLAAAIDATDQESRGQAAVPPSPDLKPTDSSPVNRTECRGQRAGRAPCSAILALCPLSRSLGWSQ